MSKVSVIGVGNVGATYASIMTINEVADEIVLLDVKEGIAEGKALDMKQASCLMSIDTRISGIPRKPGMTREELIGVNAGIVKDVVSNVLKYSPDAILVIISNPMDTMTYLVQKTSGLPKNRIIGMGGVLDSSRFKTYLSMALGDVNLNDIQACVIGGHGDTTMIPLTRYATYKGIPVSISTKKPQIRCSRHHGGATLPNCWALRLVCSGAAGATW